MAKRDLLKLYRGFAGDPARKAEKVFGSPEMKVADYYAKRRATEFNEMPGIEEILADPAGASSYNLSLPLDRHNRDIHAGQAFKVDPSAVIERKPVEFMPQAPAMYHSGTYRRGQQVDRPLYLSKDPEFARSYLDKEDNSRFMMLKPDLRSTASKDVLMDLIRKYVPGNRYYTPASAFDDNINDPREIDALIDALRKRGFDSGLAEDIPMSGSGQDDVTIMLPGTRAYANGGKVLKRLKPSSIHLREEVPLPEEANRNPTISRGPGGDLISGGYSDPKGYVDLVIGNSARPGQNPNLPPVGVKSEVQDWANRALRKYIARDLGSPNDPVRLLAEQGITHLSPSIGPLPGLTGAYGTNKSRGRHAANIARERQVPLEFFRDNLRGTEIRSREPIPGLGTIHFGNLDEAAKMTGDPALNELNQIYDSISKAGTPAAQYWNDVADSIIRYEDPKSVLIFAPEWLHPRMVDPDTGESLLEHFENNPYKVPQLIGLNPEPGLMNFAGFPKMLQFLEDSTEGRLPSQFNLRSQSLNKMSVPDVVKRMHEYEKYKSDELKKSLRESLVNSTVLDLPHLSTTWADKPGMRWVTLPDTGTPEGLDMVMDIGCQGGWCTQQERFAKQYGMSSPSERKQILSLLDSELRPHAQANVIQYGSNPPTLVEMKPFNNKWGGSREIDYSKVDPNHSAMVSQAMADLVESGSYPYTDYDALQYSLRLPVGQDPVRDKYSQLYNHLMSGYGEVLRAPSTRHRAVSHIMDSLENLKSKGPRKYYTYDEIANALKNQSPLFEPLNQSRAEYADDFLAAMEAYKKKNLKAGGPVDADT